LPEQLSRPERALVVALAGRRLLTVLLGLTGDATGDAPVMAVRNQLVADLGSSAVVVAPEVPAATGPSTEPDPPGTVFVRAPDPDEEVRICVRRTLAALAGGTAPEDVAIVARLSSPYLVLAHELLDAAGVPHHASAATSLAQSVAG